MKIMPSIGVMLLFLVSCVSESPCEQETRSDNLEILPIWEASVTQPPGVYVESYTQREGVLRNFLPPSGGWIYLPEATYDILLYSNASTKIEFRGMEALETAVAYTENGVQPDELYSGKAMTVTVKASPQNERKAGRENERIEVPMHNLVHTYPFRYQGVTGLEYVSEVRVSIGGIAQAVSLSNGSLLPGTHAVNCIYTLTADGFYGGFRCFGLGGKTDRNMFLVRFNYNGHWVEHEYDVTDMLETMGWIDIYDPIVFERPENGGVDTEVGDWDDDTVDIPIK